MDPKQGHLVGIGGVFFSDPEGKLGDWYKRLLGMSFEEPYIDLPWSANPDGYNVLSFFREPEATEYFKPGMNRLMVNFMVDDLDAVLENAKALNAEMPQDPEHYKFGRFAWVIDPEGRKVELWEPIAKI